MSRTFRTIKPYLIPFTLLISAPFARVQAQDPASSSDPTARTPPALTVVPDTLTHDGVDFPAHTITVHCMTANELFQLWRSDMKSRSRDVSGRKPTIAQGVVLDRISSTPVTVLGMTKGDRRSYIAQLTVAYAENDSTPLPSTEAQRDHVYDLAVKYNREVVERLIRDTKEELEKAKRKSEKAGSNEQRTRERLEKAKGKLEQTRVKRERAQVEKNSMDDEVARLQARYSGSGSERDRKRLQRARNRLEKRNSTLLKYMEREARYQADVNEYSTELPAEETESQARSKDVRELEEQIRDLIATREMIR